MKINILVIPPVLAAIVLTACASPVEHPVPIQSETLEVQPDAVRAPAWDQTVQVDEQGAVVVEVAPLNLNNHGDTLEFDIALNTHSVDLGMDLASLSALSTDTGMVVQAANWDAPRGGHHVSGKLMFPSTFDGNSFLDEANQITLQIRDIDADIREFVWRLK